MRKLSIIHVKDLSISWYRYIYISTQFFTVIIWETPYSGPKNISPPWIKRKLQLSFVTDDSRWTTAAIDSRIERTNQRASQYEYLLRRWWLRRRRRRKLLSYYMWSECAPDVKFKSDLYLYMTIKFCWIKSLSSSQQEIFDLLPDDDSDDVTRINSPYAHSGYSEI